MAKIQIKSEKLTPFGGFFRVMEQFDSTLSSVIDSTSGMWQNKSYIPTPRATSCAWRTSHRLKENIRNWINTSRATATNACSYPLKCDRETTSWRWEETYTRWWMILGTTAARTAQVADSMAHILQCDPQVTAVTTFVGQGSPRFHTTYAPQIGGENFAQFIVNTVDNDATEEVHHYDSCKNELLHNLL